MKDGPCFPFFNIKGFGCWTKARIILVSHGCLNTHEISSQAIYEYTSLMALGVGFFNQAGYSVIQTKVKSEKTPWALGFMMFCECQRPYNP